MQTTIIDYGMNAEGVAKVDNFIYFVPYSMFGEKVEIEVEQQFKNYAIAKLKNILVQSTKRLSPPCPYFYECGGCALQHMDYFEQLEYKALLIKKTIKKITGIDAPVSNTVASDNIFKYRNKASFNFSNNKSGFFKHNSKDIIDISYCMLLDDNINQIYSLFKEYLSKHNSIKPYIKNLVIRSIDQQILVGIVSSTDIKCNSFYDLLTKHFKQVGLYLIINKRKDSVVLSGQCKHIAGIKEINIKNYNINYNIDLLSFHQTNIDIQNKIYDKVLDYIKRDETVINAFSGAGLLSAIISKKARFVYGIEIEKSSHEKAEQLIKTNHIKNVKNILGDFNQKYKIIKEKVDTIILDPSKKGCGKDIMRQINGINSIIYISCNPIALAKDLQIIKNNYIIEEIIPFDMFANTNSVETLVKLKIKEKI